MPLFTINDIVGRSADESLEIFDYQTHNDAHDIVLARLNGEHNGGTNSRSTFTYAVSEGNLTVSIDGSPVEAKARDVVVVAPGQSKVLSGKAELFILCSPPFDPADES